MTQQLVTGQDRERVVAYIATAATESPTFQRNMEAVGLTERSLEVAESLATSILLKMEGWLEREGARGLFSERSFWDTWGHLGWGGVRQPGADWLEGMRTTRGDLPGEVVVPDRPASTFTLDQVSAIVDMAVKAATSEPEVTETEVLALDDKGKVVKRSTVVTRRQPA